MPNRNYKILLIDDDQFILDTLESAFSNTPYNTTSVTSPVKAYEMLENEPFDIVICDIVMPEMDGLTLLEKIKNYNGMIQVIMITADITIKNTLRAFRKGAVDIFFKPLEDLNEIIKVVDQIAAKLNRVNVILKRIAQDKKRNA